jgi:hypothetical protein
VCEAVKPGLDWRCDGDLDNAARFGYPQAVASGRAATDTAENIGAANSEPPPSRPACQYRDVRLDLHCQPTIHIGADESLFVFAFNSIRNVSDDSLGGLSRNTAAWHGISIFQEGFVAHQHSFFRASGRSMFCKLLAFQLLSPPDS